MGPDGKHRLGGWLLWGAPILGLAGLGLAGTELFSAGFILLGASIPCALAGGWLKRRYCPRCRAEGCEVSRAPLNHGGGGAAARGDGGRESADSR